MSPDVVPERLDAVAAMIWIWSVAVLPRLITTRSLGVRQPAD